MDREAMIADLKLRDEACRNADLTRLTDLEIELLGEIVVLEEVIVDTLVDLEAQELFLCSCL